MQSGRIIEDIMRNYDSLPFQTKELYKKYLVQVDIPTKSNASSISNEGNELAKNIESAARIKFDVSQDRVTSNSEFIKIREVAPKNNGKSNFDSIEEKLAHFVGSNSKKAIEINVPDNKTAKINLLFVYGNDNSSIEISIKTGKNSKLDLFEWHASVSNEKTAAVPVHSIDIGEGSAAEIDILHNENYNTIVGALNRSSVADNGKLNLNILYNGSSVTKSTNYASAAGKDSVVSVNELVFGNAEQRFDVGSFVLNANEGTRAVIKSGAVLKNNSFCILKGYAKVAQNAVRAYSNVEEKGVVLDFARIQPLPDMSIDCKDVVFASHSAATAPIDKEALFYLMSRGLEEQKAKRIFVASFISKYIANISNNIVKEIVMSIMLDKLDSNTLSHIPKITPENIWIVPAKK